MSEILTENFALLWQDLLQIAPRILVALFVLVISIWIGRVLGKVLSGIIQRKSQFQTHVQFVKQLITWVIILLGLVMALNILGLGTIAVSLMAGGGLAAVVFGFAFREIGENFIAGFFLTFSRSFEVGDYIESEGLKGEVKTIELRHVHIRTYDGCDIFIPSAQIFKSPLFNYTRDGLRRPGFVVGIDYSDDAGEAVKILLKAVNETESVLNTPKAMVVIGALQPQYVELQITFWVNTFDTTLSLPEIQNEVMENCCKVLKDQGFTFSANCTSNLRVIADSPFHVRSDEQA